MGCGHCAPTLPCRRRRRSPCLGAAQSNSAEGLCTNGTKPLRDPKGPHLSNVAKTTSVLATGIAPQVGTMPVTDGRSPGSQVVAPGASGPSSPSRSSFATRRGGRFVEKEASNPGCSCRHSSGFSHPLRRQADRTTRSVAINLVRQDGRPSLQYSRGVGCVRPALYGSRPSHSLLLSRRPVCRPKTIHDKD